MITARPTGKPTGEFFGEGYTLRRLGRVDDAYDGAEFKGLVAKLRSRKWKSEHPEECREHKRNSVAILMMIDRENQLSMRRRRRRKWRAKNKAKVRAADQRKHARKKLDPAYVAAARARAAEWQRRAMADPVKAAAIRARKAAWARNKKLARRAA